LLPVKTRRWSLKKNFNNETIETLVAFSNAKGGKVFIGISDSGEVTGVNITPELIQNWVNEIKTKTIPPIIPDSELLVVDGKQLVVLFIQEYPVKPVSTRGKHYIRKANSNQLLSTADVANMHLQTFNTSWDYHINNQFTVSDISFEKVNHSIELLNARGNRITDDPLTFLRKKDLIRGERLSNASFLLFAANETPLTAIELGRFQTDTIIKDSTRSKSDILSQAEFVVAFVMKHINKEVIITGTPENTQKWQYPIEAIREIVMNMIIHRDYRSSSDSIVKIFDNRIEFYNPGRLPDNITIQDLLTNNYKSTPRNKIIADFCKDLGLIEKYGSGIKRILEYFAKQKLPAPVFQNISDGFVVTIFGKENEDVGKNVGKDVGKDVGKELKKSLAKVLATIKKNPQITIPEIALQTKYTPRTVERNLSVLKKMQIIQRLGGRKEGSWKIINPKTR
jgi:ATP-dependent DNA helicase RecG